MYTDELVLFTELDEDVGVHQDHLSLLHKVNMAIDRAITDKDLEGVSSICQSLVSATKIAGLALANVLGKVSDAWVSFSANEDFIDYMSATTGLNIRTIERYVRVYNLMKSVPDDVREVLETRNIKNIIPIANAMAQGYEIEQDEWEKIKGATSFEEVSAFVRQIKGADPRVSSMRLWCDRDGSIWACQKETVDGDTIDRRVFVGSVEVSDPDPLVTKAVKRILDNSGILAQ